MIKYIILFLAFTLIQFAQEQLVLKPGPDEGKDAWFWSYPQYRDDNWGVPRPGNFGTHNVFRAEAWIWFNSGRTDTLRGTIEFDLSQLPEGAILDSAKLNLFYYSNPGYTKQEGENACYIERVIQPWEESVVTWNNQPATTEVDRIMLPPSESATSDYSIDVTNFTQFFIENPDSNFGLMFKMVEEMEYRGLTFASSDHKDETLWPELVLYYHADESNEFKINFRQMNPHVGQNLYIRFVDQSHLNEVHRDTILISANFDYTTDKLEEGTSYYVDFFADLNNNSQYDPPPTDHAWRLEVDSTSAVDSVEFIHNINFTDIEWPVSTSVGDEEINYTFKLEQNYPNPFNPTTSIEFSLPSNGEVQLTVYDTLGREVTFTEFGRMSAGLHSVEFDAAKLSSGVYFYKLNFKGQSLIKKMTLIK